MRRRIASSVSGCVLVLAVAACGGGSDEPAVVDAETVPSAAQTTVVAGEVGDDAVQTTVSHYAEPTPASSDGVAAGGSGTGFIEIGDLRQELTIVRCATFSGAMGGTAFGVNDPTNVQVDFEFSPEDWRDRDASEGWDNNGRIKYSEPTLSWLTGQGEFVDFVLPDDVDVASLDITSLRMADNRQSASGEATFFELDAFVTGAPIAPAQGSFEFSCPPA